MEPMRLEPDPAASAAMADAALPGAVAWLGYGGLVPFVGLAAASVLDENHAVYWADGLFAYGAIILSFIGALHWGYALSLGASISEAARARRNACFAWSVVPSLIAWLALLLPASLSTTGRTGALPPLPTCRPGTCRCACASAWSPASVWLWGAGAESGRTRRSSCP
jgi:hypothetical protein